MGLVTSLAVLPISHKHRPCEEPGNLVEAGTRSAKLLTCCLPFPTDPIDGRGTEQSKGISRRHQTVIMANQTGASLRCILSLITTTKFPIWDGVHGIGQWLTRIINSGSRPPGVREGRVSTENKPPLTLVTQAPSHATDRVGLLHSGLFHPGS